MAAESTEAMAVPADQAGMVVDDDAVAAEGDAIPSDFIQGTFKPSETTVQAQDSYEYPFLGLNFTIPEELQKHAEWAEDILARHPELNGDTVHLILQDEVGQVFAQVLADAGVYKLDEAGRAGFVRFLASVK